MYLSLIIIPLMFGFASDTGDSWQVALCNIGLFGSSDIIHCDELQDTFILKEGTNITIDLDNATKTVTFSASGTGSGPNELYCTVGKWFNAFNATTNNFNCETVPTFSDATTASNVGTGEGVFSIEVGDDLRFNSLIGGQGIDAVNTVNDITISTDFKIDTLPTIGVNKFISAFDNSTGDWTTKTFSINTTSCSGTNRVSAVDNATGIITCSTGENTTATNLGTSGHGVYESEVSDQLRFKKIACTGLTCTNNATNITLTVSGGSGNMTVLGDAGDATITSPASMSILHYINSQWIDKIFAAFSKTGSAGNLLYSFDNQTGTFGTATIKNVLLDGSNHTDTVAQSPTQGSIIYSDATPKWNELVKGSTGQVLTSTASTIEWATPSSGSGIPLPPKKWGELIPKSSSTDTIGLVAGCSILATATYVYDTTDNSNAILSTTAITDGINGGIHCSGTDHHLFRGDQNAYMYSKVEWNKITTNRVFVGFVNSATHLPNNADTICDNLSCYGICVRTSDANIQECRNDGDATTDYTSTGLTETAGTVYAIEVYAKSGGTSWCYKINGSAESCQTTEIPASTTRMYADSTGETDGGATAILWTQYLWYLQSDK